MAYSIGENQYKEFIVQSYYKSSPDGYEKARLRLTTGKRTSKGLPLKVQIHFDMLKESSYFGFAIGYKVNAKVAGKTIQLSKAEYARYATKNGRVVSGYGLGDDKNLIKQYGGYYGDHDGSWDGDSSSYWRGSDGWLPKDSGPKRGTSVLFDGTVPMSATDSSFKLSVEILRDYMCSPQTGIENLVWFKFKEGSFDCNVSCSQWKVEPGPPKSLYISPVSVPLEDANRTKLNLKFTRGSNAVSSEVYLCWDFPGHARWWNKVETFTGASYDKWIDPSKFIDQDSTGIKEIALLPENVGCHVWFTVRSVSVTGHKSAEIATKTVEYTETPTDPPSYMNLDDTCFFEGGRIRFDLGSMKNGTFPIASLAISDEHDMSYDLISDSGEMARSGTVDIGHFGFDGWDTDTGRRPMTFILKATDIVGRDIYAVLGRDNPKSVINGIGATVFQKQDDDSWSMGVVYQKQQDGSWKAGYMAHTRQESGWKAQ